MFVGAHGGCRDFSLGLKGLRFIRSRVPCIGFRVEGWAPNVGLRPFRVDSRDHSGYL